MTVKIIPIGSLKDYCGGKGELEVPAVGSIRDILSTLSIPPEIIALVMVNDTPGNKDYVPIDGDVIKVMAVIGGG